MSKGSTLGALTITDTLGRPVISTTGFGSTGAQINVVGTTSSYTLTWGTQSVNYSMAVTVASDSGLFAGDCSNRSATFSGTANVLTSISLPNGEAFQFTYDPVYGNLAKIVYPTGAYVRYQWGVNSQSDSATGTYELVSGGGSSVVGNVYCGFRFDMPAVTDRWVSFDGVTEALHQHFSYSTSWGTGVLWTSKVTTVTTYDLSRGTSSTTTHSYVPDPQTGGGIWSVYQSGMSSSTVAGSPIPVESSTVVNDYGGNVIESINNTWNNLYALAQQSVTVGTGASAETHKSAYTYDTYGELTEKDDYDYGASSPSRKALTSYQGFGFANLFPKLVDRPCKTTTTDGAGNSYAERDTYYDGGTTLCSLPAGQQLPVVSGLPASTHDETNYGTGSSTLRGNVTQQVRITSSGTSPKSTFTYDETGQRISSTDPCGNTSCTDMVGTNHPTYYSYLDDPSGGNPAGNSNAYLTQITDPLGHTQSFSYNYSTGELASSTDENNQTTNYTYSDPLNRLTKVQGPPDPDNGNQRPTTTYLYNDSGPNPSVTTSISLNSSQTETKVSVMDGLGRAVQTQLTSDPKGTDYVNTLYDGEGNVYQQSNPTRCTSSPGSMPSSCSEPTWGITTFNYDALGRRVSQTQPDGSVLYWCYDGTASFSGQKNCVGHIGSASGAWVDFTDESGNHWQRTSDALGRLTEVVEDAGGAKLETDYQYDALNDLLRVDQWGGSSGSAGDHVRGFTYDSLGRLQTSTNPEVGTISYTYDADGNVVTKTAPAPNALAGNASTVTTSYTYDALNRLLSKRSVDGAATPAACYQYDQSAQEDSSANTTGRLVNEWTQSATANNSSCALIMPTSGTTLLTSKSILSYDPMGRINKEQTCVYPTCTTTIAQYPMTYTYDLAGNITSYKNGNDSILYTKTYDGAWHLSTINSTPVGSKYPSPRFSYPVYSPAGSLSGAAYGTGTGITLCRWYDNRLRITGETDTSGPVSGSTTCAAGQPQ